MTDSWNHARHHVQAEDGTYDDKIDNGTEVVSTTAERGNRKVPTEQ